MIVTLRRTRYFEEYGKFGIHVDMLRDQSRMTSYHRAIMGNPQDFKDKVVLDVGCGTSVLSCWCARAGARKGLYSLGFFPCAVCRVSCVVCACARVRVSCVVRVCGCRAMWAHARWCSLMVVGAVYAVEASSMAEQAQLVVDRNGLSDIVQIINAKMEDVNLPEQVDVIVSEVHAILIITSSLARSPFRASAQSDKW